MALLDKLKTSLGAGNFDLGVAGRKTSGKPKTARDAMLEAIDHSIAYLKNPKYRLLKGRRKGKEPELMYRLDGDTAYISLRYARVRLQFDSKNNEITTSEKLLATALTDVRSAVAEGEFDAQLEKIKSARSAAAKGGRPKKAA